MQDTLSDAQILLLRKIKDNTHSTITEIIAVLSEENRLPKSTLRSNASKLRKTGLIDCGTSENKGIPVMLTDSGKEIMNILDSGQVIQDHDKKW